MRTTDAVGAGITAAMCHGPWRMVWPATWHGANGRANTASRHIVPSGRRYNHGHLGGPRYLLEMEQTALCAEDGLKVLHDGPNLLTTLVGYGYTVALAVLHVKYLFLLPP